VKIDHLKWSEDFVRRFVDAREDEMDEELNKLKAPEPDFSPNVRNNNMEKEIMKAKDYYLSKANIDTDY
jgi:hypothetical protein